MQILLRIIKMAWRYRARLILAYLSFFAAIGFALLIPRLFGSSIDRLVRFDPSDGRVIPLQVDTWTLVLMALALLGASLLRGVFDFARMYTSDSLSHKVSYDLRTLLYDKLQHLSFAFHDAEHIGVLELEIGLDQSRLCPVNRPAVHCGPAKITPDVAAGAGNHG
jgi:ATP-binding cassette subfamily B multidrug efflux pump